jgi:carbonic anhydrase
MKKLVRGIVEFRQKTYPDYAEKFARLALGQRPDSLFIACSDSRVVPNLFASTDPGDLFVVRNVGNLIPSCGSDGVSTADESEAAAIEFALMNLQVSDIIVCGHSDCGAMHAILNGRGSVPYPNLRSWLRHGETALKLNHRLNADLSEVNKLSQLNVLQQMEHLKSYPSVKARVEQGSLGIHGWWFELRTASVYAFEEIEDRFILIDEVEAERILKRLNKGTK